LSTAEYYERETAFFGSYQNENWASLEEGQFTVVSTYHSFGKYHQTFWVAGNISWIEQALSG
jgi:hypothetical protein